MYVVGQPYTLVMASLSRTCFLHAVYWGHKHLWSAAEVLKPIHSVTYKIPGFNTCIETRER